jgi:hypothetical protein
MKNPVLDFFVLVTVLSVPFYLVSAVTEFELLPGLPVPSLAAFCPVTAAGILTYEASRGAGVAALLKRSFDFRRIRAKVWFVPVAFLMPAVMALSFAAIRLSGVAVPVPEINVLQVSILLAAFFLAALGEELGWCGFAIDPMQAKWGALQAAIVQGLFWVFWHYVPLFQAGRPVAWIAWWSVGSVALRVITVWLYNNTGRSVFAASFFHTTINLTWQLFPVNGSYYDPVITGVILVCVAAFVVVVGGARSLATYRTTPTRHSGARRYLSNAQKIPSCNT